MAPRPTTMSRPPRQGGARKRTNTTSNNPLKQMTHGSHSNPMAAARWYAPVQEQTNGAVQTRVPASVEPNLSTDCQQSYLGDQLAGEVLFYVPDKTRNLTSKSWTPKNCRLAPASRGAWALAAIHRQGVQQTKILF
jgi:hypothetical protein